MRKFRYSSINNKKREKNNKKRIIQFILFFWCIYRRGNSSFYMIRILYVGGELFFMIQSKIFQYQEKIERKNIWVFPFFSYTQPKHSYTLFYVYPKTHTYLTKYAKKLLNLPRIFSRKTIRTKDTFFLSKKLFVGIFSDYPHVYYFFWRTYLS